MRILFSTIVLGCSLVLIGCGGKDKDGITYEIPTDVLVIPQGSSKEAKVSRKGKTLKDADLTLTSSDPKVTVENVKFKGDAKEVMVTIKAAADAPEKEHTITIKAGDVTKTMKVRVEKVGGAVVDDTKGKEAKKDEKTEKEKEKEKTKS